MKAEINEAQTGCVLCHDTRTIAVFNGHDDRYGAAGEFTVHICSRCHVSFLAPPPLSQALAELYQHYNEGEPPSVSVRPSTGFARFIWWWIGDPHPARSIQPQDRVLDVGCGPGFTLAVASSRGASAVGIDLNRKSIEILKGRGFDVRVGTLQELAEPEASFTKIIFDQVLEHVIDPVNELKQARRFLAPQGQIFVATPHINSLVRYLSRQAWLQWHIPYHVCLFSREALERVGKCAGLRMTGCRQVTPSAWLLAQWRHRRPPPGQANRGLRLDFPIWQRMLIGPLGRMMDLFGRGEALVAEFCADDHARF